MKQDNICYFFYFEINYEILKTVALQNSTLYKKYCKLYISFDFTFNKYNDLINDQINSFTIFLIKTYHKSQIYNKINK